MPISNIPPQGGLWMLQRPSLDKLELKAGECSGFVNTSASCAAVEIGKRCSSLDKIFSRTTWQSNSMCLLLSWKVGLWARYMVDLLSQ